MHKKDLRKTFLEKRRQYSSDGLSNVICKKAVNLLQFQKAETVMVYLPSNFEVDTSAIIETAKKHGKKICAPRVLNDTEMEAALLDEKGLQKGAFNILEPRGERIYDIDIVFVPGVAFDKACNRLGYGKGYYDRFLNNRNTFAVGLAFSCQIAEKLPTAPHDMRLNMILTENEVYE